MKNELSDLERKVIAACEISEADYLRQREKDRAAARAREARKIPTMQSTTDRMRTFLRAVESAAKPEAR